MGDAMGVYRGSRRKTRSDTTCSGGYGGEFNTRREATRAIGVRKIVHDRYCYDFLKMLALPGLGRRVRALSARLEKNRCR